MPVWTFCRNVSKADAVSFLSEKNLGNEIGFRPGVSAVDKR